MTTQRPHEPEQGASPTAAPVEDRFCPDWGQLEDLWMGRMAYTSFVERHEYELGFQRFQQETRTQAQIELLEDLIQEHQPPEGSSLADPSIAISAVIQQRLSDRLEQLKLDR